MSNITAILKAEFEALKNEIIAAYEGSGRNASGAWASTLEMDITENGATIRAADYINGRDPGAPPPSEAIEAWLANKGVAAQIEEGLSRESLAYLISRKIGREGWKPRPGAEFTIDSIATPQRIQQIMDKVEVVELDDFTTGLISYLKEAGL